MGGVKDLGPLDWRTPIVDGAGRPSPEFQRRWNTQRDNNGLIGTITFGSGAPTGTPTDGAEYVNVSTTPYTVYLGKGGAWHQAGAVAFTDLKDAPHSYAGAGLALVRVKQTADGVEFVSPSAMLDGFGTPADGQLLQRGATAWGLVTLSALLDGIANTHGSVLYRGAAGWSALGPGTAGYVLQTGGPGADPSWVAQSGGGGGVGVEYLGLLNGILSNSTNSLSTGYWQGHSLLIPYNFTIQDLSVRTLTAQTGLAVTPAIYSDNAGVPGSLLVAGPTAASVSAGVTDLTLSSTYAVPAGTAIWIGVIVNTKSLVLQGASVNEARCYFSNGTNTPPTTPTGLTFDNYAWKPIFLKGQRT